MHLFNSANGLIYIRRKIKNLLYLKSKCLSLHNIKAYKNEISKTKEKSWSAFPY